MRFWKKCPSHCGIFFSYFSLEFLLLESNDLNGLIPTQVCNLWNLHLQSLGMKITSEKNQEQCSDDFYGGLQCPNQECCKDCPNQVAQ
mmetsp:Transcript_5646/g.12549  ORF Transcript_5646/g.12549 Transcript_5646/m.12549 type:complete len:88 (-) Transcript_5646:478-741(-)